MSVNLSAATRHDLASAAAQFGALPPPLCHFRDNDHLLRCPQRDLPHPYLYDMRHRL